MDQRDRAFQLRIAEVVIESGQLIRTEHPFVDQRARGQACDIAVAAGNFAQRGFDLPSNHIELYFKRGVGVDIKSHSHPRDEYLTYDGARTSRGPRQHGVIDGNIAPAKYGAPFLRYRCFDHSLADDAGGVTSREEQHAHSITARVGQSDSYMAAGSPEKSMRHLQQNAGAVASARVGRNSAPVRKILEELERFPDYVARANAMDVRDESNSARVVLIGRVV
jgi:hypothetical protein